MEKRNIIDEILSEWAMRSDDGLSGGYDSLNNGKILAAMLSEYGVPKVDVDSIVKKMFCDHKLINRT